MPVEDIITRLDFCKPSGKDAWMARCPAHDDNGPSLSIKDAGGGRTLIHCHAGCGALDVLDALGLDWSALYPPTDQHHYSPVTRRQAKESEDAMIVEIFEHDRAMGKRRPKRDVEVYRAAKKRVARRKEAESDVVVEIAYESGVLHL